jgi:hypothetical protein
MPNKWVEYVRSYANQNNLSYACAMTQPACKEGYRAKFGVAKKVPQKVERERMGLEDINIKPPPARRKPAQHSKEAFKMAGEDISSRLMRENIPYPPVQIKIPRKKVSQQSKEAFKMAGEDISSRLMRENIPYPVQERYLNFEDIYQEAPAQQAPAKRGRKPKYATDAERAAAKRQQTLASNLFKTRERAKEKKEGKKMGKEDKR